MTRPVPTTPAATGTTGLRPGRARGWWGVAFVLLLLVSESAVALPLTTHSTSFLTGYYAAHRWPITVAQCGELVAALLLWWFVRALADSLPDGSRTAAVRYAGLAVCLVSLQTSAPVLALALLPGQDPATARALAGWTDSSDILLFAAVTVWCLACVRAELPGWVRTAAVVAGGLALARVVVGLTGSEGLAQLAPVAFVAFVLTLSVRMLTGRRG